MSAPSSTSRRPCAIAASGIGMLAAVGERIRRDVDDAHHARHVEHKATAAAVEHGREVEHQRAPRRRASSIADARRRRRPAPRRSRSGPSPPRSRYPRRCLSPGRRLSGRDCCACGPPNEKGQSGLWPFRVSLAMRGSGRGGLRATEREALGLLVSPGRRVLQPLGGGGSRPSMISSICVASMVSYSSSAFGHGVQLVEVVGQQLRWCARRRCRGCRAPLRRSCARCRRTRSCAASPSGRGTPRPLPRRR